MDNLLFEPHGLILVSITYSHVYQHSYETSVAFGTMEHTADDPLELLTMYDPTICSLLPFPYLP